MAEIVARRSMTRSVLERFLRSLSPPGENAATLYITPATPQDVLTARLGDLIGRDNAILVGEMSGPAETGAVLLWEPSRGYLLLPPLPVQEEGLSPGWNIKPLQRLLAQEPLIGVLLLRLGKYAVGVYRGGALISSKTGARYVKGRHHAGGTSQGRFARVREKQVHELFKAVCGVLEKWFDPYEGRLEHVFLGGERFTLQAFRHQCPYLERFSTRIRRRILNVGEPGLKALEQLPEEIGKSQVYTFG